MKITETYIQKFYDIFIGNDSAYGFQKPDGSWKAIKKKITLELLKKHLNKEITIGSYNIYKYKGYEWCKWICIDIDAHHPKTKELDIELKKKIDKIIKPMTVFTLSVYNIPDKSVLLEASGMGYHIWIFLKEQTTLKRVYALKENIENRLIEEFGIEIEVFPKQESLKGLKGFGNFVKLPFSINRKNNFESKSVFEFDLMKVEPFEIKDIVSRIRKKKKIDKNIRYVRKKKNHKSEVDLTKWTPYNKVAEEFYEKLRPCIKAIVNGEKQAVGKYGHLMRIQVANELFRLHAPEEVRILAFKNQDDFNPEKVQYQVQDLERRCRINQRFFLAQCETIQKYGYCIPTCYKLGYTKSSKVISPVIKKKRGGIINGWEGLKKVIQEKLQYSKKVFFEKTTRSGVSWAIIIESLRAGKKLLVIGPTIKLAEDMIREAMEYAQMDTKMFKFGSNKELCNLVKREVLKYEILKNFPFFIKGNCRGCKEDCLMKEARDHIDEYDLIYTTIAKLDAFLKSKDPMTKEIFRKIIKHVDLIFLDEVSHVIESGSEEFEYFTKPDLIYSSKVPAVNFYKNFQHQYQEFLNSGILNTVNVGRTEIETILKACWVFVENIKIRLSTEFLPGSNFILMKSEVYQQIEELDKFHDEEKKNHKHYGSGIMDWLNLYKLFMKYAKKTDTYLKALVKVLLVGKYEEYYIQKTSPLKYEEKIEIFPALHVKEILDLIEKNNKNKIFFCTDATEPPIPPEDLFSGIERVFVNDPMNTARLSTVYYDSRNKNVSKFTFIKKDLTKFLKKFSDKQTFLISQNIQTYSNIYDLVKKEKIEHGTSTYFRSDKTIGVASPLRKMITIGSPHPPKNCYMWLADLYRREGISELDLEELGRKLEFYNAKSTFFQSISRVKDPYGKVKSEIYCYGLNKKKIKSLLNFDIAIPGIKKIPD